MTANEERATAPSEEAKAKFRAALDRKKAKSHRSADAPEGAEHMHESETTGPTQRTFRRKSG